MSYEQIGLDVTRRSSGDMSSHQYKLVTFSTANDAKGCILSTERGTLTHGVWQGPKSTVAEYGRVRVVGVTKVAAGDSSAMDVAITAGSLLQASSVGQAVPSTAGTVNPNLVGFAMESLSTGSTGIISMFAFVGLNSTST